MTKSGNVLQLYGLDKELSSDTDDTDYEIGKPNDECEREVRKKSLKRKIARSVDSVQNSRKFSLRKKSSMKIEHKQQGSNLNLIEKNVSPNEDTWSVLPTEILSYIFRLLMLSPLEVANVRFVSRCAQVCRHWNEVVKQPVAWRTADLAFMGGTKRAKDKTIIKLVKTRFSNLKELNLCGWTDITDVGLFAVSKCCKKLESLNISSCQRKGISKVTEASLVALAKHCPLKKIFFSNLHVAKKYAKAVNRFLELSGNNLTHIDLSENIALGSFAFTSICNYCSNLKSIDLSNTSVRNVCFSTFQESCQLLEELYLSNLRLEPKPFKYQKARGFPALKICSLSVQDSSGWLTDDLLLGITKNAENLILLDIRGNLQITIKGFCLCTTKLEKLYISGCKINVDISQLIFQKWSNKLLHIDLSKIKLLQGSMDEILTICVNRCSKLTHLDLAGTSVSDILVRHILNSLPGLNFLNLTSCYSLSRGIKRIHFNEELRNLSEKLKKTESIHEI